MNMTPEESKYFDEWVKKVGQPAGTFDERLMSPEDRVILREYLAKLEGWASAAKKREYNNDWGSYYNKEIRTKDDIARAIGWPDAATQEKYKDDFTAFETDKAARAWGFPDATTFKTYRLKYPSKAAAAEAYMRDSAAGTVQKSSETNAPAQSAGLASLESAKPATLQDAISDLKAGDKLTAENRMREIAGLPPLSAVNTAAAPVDMGLSADMGPAPAAGFTPATGQTELLSSQNALLTSLGLPSLSALPAPVAASVETKTPYTGPAWEVKPSPQNPGQFMLTRGGNVDAVSDSVNMLVSMANQKNKDLGIMEPVVSPVAALAKVETTMQDALAAIKAGDTSTATDIMKQIAGPGAVSGADAATETKTQSGIASLDKSSKEVAPDLSMFTDEDGRVWAPDEAPSRDYVAPAAKEKADPRTAPLLFDFEAYEASADRNGVPRMQITENTPGAVYVPLSSNQEYGDYWRAPNATEISGAKLQTQINQLPADIQAKIASGELFPEYSTTFVRSGRGGEGEDVPTGITGFTSNGPDGSYYTYDLSGTKTGQKTNQSGGGFFDRILGGVGDFISDPSKATTEFFKNPGVTEAALAVAAAYGGTALGTQLMNAGLLTSADTAFMAVLAEGGSAAAANAAAAAATTTATTVGTVMFNTAAQIAQGESPENALGNAAISLLTSQYITPNIAEEVKSVISSPLIESTVTNMGASLASGVLAGQNENQILKSTLQAGLTTVVRSVANDGVKNTSDPSDSNTPALTASDIAASDLAAFPTSGIAGTIPAEAGLGSLASSVAPASVAASETLPATSELLASELAAYPTSGIVGSTPTEAGLGSLASTTTPEIVGATEGALTGGATTGGGLTAAEIAAADLAAFPTSGIAETIPAEAGLGSLVSTPAVATEGALAGATTGGGLTASELAASELATYPTSGIAGTIPAEAGLGSLTSTVAPEALVNDALLGGADVTEGALASTATTTAQEGLASLGTTPVSVNEMVASGLTPGSAGATGAVTGALSPEALVTASGNGLGSLLPATVATGTESIFGNPLLTEGGLPQEVLNATGTSVNEMIASGTAPGSAGALGAVTGALTPAELAAASGVVTTGATPALVTAAEEGAKSYIDAGGSSQSGFSGVNGTDTALNAADKVAAGTTSGGTLSTAVGNEAVASGLTPGSVGAAASAAGLLTPTQLAAVTGAAGLGALTGADALAANLAASSNEAVASGLAPGSVGAAQAAAGTLTAAELAAAAGTNTGGIDLLDAAKKAKDLLDKKKGSVGTTAGGLGLAALMAMMNKNKSADNNTYTGTVPTYSALRQQLPVSQTRPGSAATPYRPGQGGITYFTPVNYNRTLDPVAESAVEPEFKAAVEPDYGYAPRNLESDVKTAQNEATAAMSQRLATPNKGFTGEQIGGEGFELNPRYAASKPGESMNMEYIPQYIQKGQFSLEEALQSIKNHANGGLMGYAEGGQVSAGMPSYPGTQSMNYPSREGGYGYGGEGAIGQGGLAPQGALPQFAGLGSLGGNPLMAQGMNPSMGMQQMPRQNGINGLYGGANSPPPHYTTGGHSLDPSMQNQQTQPNVGMAGGGSVPGQYNLGSYSDGGRLLKGPGDGVSDSIPAIIGKKQPARLATGEFVIPARIVSELGNGSTDAGAKRLYDMMKRVQQTRRKTKNVAANTNAAKYLPA